MEIVVVEMVETVVEIEEVVVEKMKLLWELW